MEVLPVVWTTYQEEQVGGLAIRRAKGDLLNRPAQREERRLKQIRLRVARMQQSQSARDAGRAERLARLQAFQQRARIRDAPCLFGQRRHLAQNGGLGLGG